MKARLAQLDQVETARKEAERAQLEAEYKAAAAVSKVYDDALKEEKDQYLGSDDPDADENRNDDVIPPRHDIVAPTKDVATHHNSRTPIQNGMAFTPNQAETPKSHNIFTSKPLFKPPAFFSKIGDDDRNTLEHNSVIETPLRRSTPKSPFGASTSGLNVSSQVSLLEKMELRMSQPPPKPIPFNGDPVSYLRFKANFKEQVESRVSLSDSEKMNYLLSYTTGRARELIENYQGLPNACKLSLELLQRRCGQTSMIVEELKSTVMVGDKIKPGDGAALLALSDKLENCCYTMSELNSNELNCTTNLRRIYNRLPESLQRKWRKTAKSYRERHNGGEPTLKDLSKFICDESQAENDPVYGKATDIKPNIQTHRQQRKPAPIQGTKIATLATPVQMAKSNECVSNPKQETLTKPKELCQVCLKETHYLSKCPVFISKTVNQRRRIAKSMSLCYLCLSNSHIRKNCTVQTNCKEKDCKSPNSHNTLLHVSDRMSEGTSDVAVHKTSTNTTRSFVRLKVVPLLVTGENGTSLSMYGL